MADDINDSTIPVPPPQAVAPAPVAASGLADNIAAALAYVTFIPALIFLVTEPYSKNPFVQFHSMQSIGLFVVWVGCFILQSVLLIIPILGFLLSMLIGFALFGVWCFTVYKAYSGEWFKLPFLGDFALAKSKG